MKTKTYNVYTYDELTEEQQQKAIERYYDINVDNEFWHDFTLEEETERLETLGYTDAKIFYSGFWSQGDGASFTATGDIEKLVPKKMRKFIENITFSKSHQYEHEYTMSVHIDYSDEPMERIQPVEFENLENELLENARDEARKVYKRLHSEYDYLTSEEAVVETFRANEYEFTTDGRID